MDTNILPIELALREHLQAMPTSIVAALARGDVDARIVARLVLAAQGLDSDGAWIGFPEAKAHHIEAVSALIAAKSDSKSDGVAR